MNVRSDLENAPITPVEMPEAIRGTRDAIFYLLRQHQGGLDEDQHNQTVPIPDRPQPSPAPQSTTPRPIPEAVRETSPHVRVQEQVTQYRFRLGRIRIPATAPRSEKHLPMDEFVSDDDDGAPGHFPGTPDRWTFG